MLNRLRSAISNVVGTSIEDTHNGYDQGSGASHSNSSHGNTPGSRNGANHQHQRSSHKGENVSTKPVKHVYGRPHFLDNLTTQDEIQVSADHAVRPIIVPRDVTCLPWNSGYAETINSGKSLKNEDQARCNQDFLEIDPPPQSPTDVNTNNATNGNENGSPKLKGKKREKIKLPYYYFALFDGHAGAGAAVAASLQLHKIVKEKLMNISHHLINEGEFCEFVKEKKGKGILWFPNTNVTKDSLIIGALESAFHDMDLIIEEDNRNFDGVNGGCTVVVCLFILNKVFIANAGDSRAILCRRNSQALALSNDFTPETERARVRHIAAKNPILLGNEFTANDYLRRPVKQDLGSKILFRGPFMTGWSYKTATTEDLKFPLVFGHGKRSRVLATIGVTRGFGDHELYSHNTNIRIKPFLSSQPEVRILEVETNNELGEDDCIVMGTDGLWDVCSNDTAASIVFTTLDQFPVTESDRFYFKYRYTSAAQDLVMHARGKFNDRNWKMTDGSPATIDDISVFVIPLWPYKMQLLQKGKQEDTKQDQDKQQDIQNQDQKQTDQVQEKEKNQKVEPAISPIIEPTIEINAEQIQIEEKS